MTAAGYQVENRNMCMGMCMPMSMRMPMRFVSIFSDSFPKKTRNDVPLGQCGAAHGF